MKYPTEVQAIHVPNMLCSGFEIQLWRTMTTNFWKDNSFADENSIGRRDEIRQNHGWNYEKRDTIRNVKQEIWPKLTVWSDGILTHMVRSYAAYVYKKGN